MGCWNGTCMISNLPIHDGNRIKVVLLRPNWDFKNIIQGSAYVYSDGILTPSFLPISGKYNDYGMIEDIDQDWNTELIEKELKKILGDKIIADGEEIKDYTLENILRGIERNDLKFIGADPQDVKDKEMAEKAIKAFKEYNQRCGTKNTNDFEEDWQRLLNIDTSPKERRLKASWVMIREDIWNHIIKTYKGQFWNFKEPRGENDPYYVSGREWCKHQFDKDVETYKGEDKLFLGFGEKIFSRHFAGDSNLLSPFLYNNTLMEAVKNNDQEKMNKIFEDWFEFVMINSFISHTRRGWMIQSGAGSQTEAWEEHKLLAEKVLKICDTEIKKWDDENE